MRAQPIFLVLFRQPVEPSRLEPPFTGRLYFLTPMTNQEAKDQRKAHKQAKSFTPQLSALRMLNAFEMDALAVAARQCGMVLVNVADSDQPRRMQITDRHAVGRPPTSPMNVKPAEERLKFEEKYARLMKAA